MVSNRHEPRSERLGRPSYDATARSRHPIAASLHEHPSRSTACLTTLHEPCRADPGRVPYAAGADLERPIQSRMPLRGTSKDENCGRSPVEPGNVTGAVSPSFSLAPGPLGTNNCRREHECQSLRCAKTPRAATPDHIAGRASRWTYWWIGARGWTCTRTP